MSASAAVDAALRKLVNVLGAERAAEIERQTLARIGLAVLRTPDDRYRFASDLMQQGGVLASIGRAMRIQAVLHGATERAGP